MGTPGLNASIMAPRTIHPQDSTSPPNKQLTLFVTIQVDPSNIEKFKEAHRPVWKACSEEPECLFFDVFQDPESPGRFRFVEVWSKSREWFEKVGSYLRK
jgi:quinol monooxygenase YgiN